jgi:hypothetical protein
MSPIKNDVSGTTVDLACQHLMSRWGVSEKVARGMIAIEGLGSPKQMSIAADGSPAAA